MTCIGGQHPQASLEQEVADYSENAIPNIHSDICTKSGDERLIAIVTHWDRLPEAARTGRHAIVLAVASGDTTMQAGVVAPTEHGPEAIR